MTTIGVQQRFWDWFGANHQRYRNLSSVSGTQKDNLLEALLNELSKVQEHLFVEIGDETDGDSELIIHAAGRRELFDAVEELVDAAPPLAGWTFFALKPAAGPGGSVRYGNALVDTKRAWFEAEPVEGGAFAVTLYFHGLRAADEEDTLDASIIALSSMLGERAFAENVASIVVAPATPSRLATLQHLVGLPDFIASKKSTLH